MSVILEEDINLNMSISLDDETMNDIDDDKNFELNNTWVLWFHKVNDNNWTLNSYVKVYEMSNYFDLLFIMRSIENISSGMFFLMKKGILPIFEDENNKHGGNWSIRITKKDSFDFWQKIIYYMCIKNITIDKNYESKINGISISPKINNCIFKIWTSDFKGMKTDYMRKDLEFINWNDTFYLQHNCNN
jgi:hypothetical protein